MYRLKVLIILRVIKLDYLGDIYQIFSRIQQYLLVKVGLIELKVHISD